jgi:hypothetical protein
LKRATSLRESYRELLRANRKVERARRPYMAEQKRIKAYYDRERSKNEIMMKEYQDLLEKVKGTIQQIQAK